MIDSLLTIRAVVEEAKMFLTDTVMFSVEDRVRAIRLEERLTTAEAIASDLIERLRREGAISATEEIERLRK